MITYWYSLRYKENIKLRTPDKIVQHCFILHSAAFYLLDSVKLAQE